MKKSFQKNIWLEFLLPGIYMATVLMVDVFEPIGTITPFFAVVGLLFMAIKYRPAVMIPWAILYTLIVSSIFLVPKLFILFSGHPYYDQYVIPIIRAATYILVGVVSCYVCILLERLRKTEVELTSILSSLPWPILTSNNNGKIIYWNEATELLIPELTKKKLLHSYFDLLAPQEFHGRTIASYIKRMEDDQHLEPLDLSVNGNSFKGHTQLLRWSGNKILLTILSQNNTSPPYSAPQLTKETLI